MMAVLNVLLLLRFVFYNPLIISSVCYACLCRCFCRNSAVTCVRTSVLLTMLCKKSLHSKKGVLSSTVPQFENDRLLFRRYNIYINIYIINLFSQSQRSVNNELWNCGTVELWILYPQRYI